MIETRFTRDFAIEFPLIQGGMAWVADASLAAAVSEAGGLGLIAGGAAPTDVIRYEIRKARTLTKKPFGLNIMLMSEFADDLAQLVVEEKVPFVVTGAGSPGKYMELWKKNGVTVIPVVASTALAVRMEKMGADAVVAEGCEAGGHIGELTTMALVPQVVDAVRIPVIAAGGIADGRTAAAAFMLGADAVQCGTVFLVADECTIHDTYKDKVIAANDIGTQVTGRSGGHPIRQLKSPFVRAFLEKEKSGASLEELELFAAGSLRKAAREGDRENGSFMAGQIAGLVAARAPVAEIIKRMFVDAESVMHKTLQRVGGEPV